MDEQDERDKKAAAMAAAKAARLPTEIQKARRVELQADQAALRDDFTRINSAIAALRSEKALKEEVFRRNIVELGFILNGDLLVEKGKDKGETAKETGTGGSKEMAKQTRKESHRIEKHI